MSRESRRPDRTTPGVLAALLAGAVLCACAARGRAQDAPEINPSILAVNNNAGLSYITSSFYYIEPDDGSMGTGYLDSEKGNMKGGRLEVSVMSPSGGYFHFSYGGTEGLANYDGFIGAVPANLTSRETMQELDLRVGMGLLRGKTWLLAPYVSAGRRYWMRELGVGTSGDFVESYNFSYFGLGNLIQYSPWERWVFTGNASVAMTVDPAIKVGALSFSAPLGSAPVIRLGAEADCRVSGNFHVFAGVEYLHYNFNQSATQITPTAIPLAVIEPYSRTDLYTGALGLRYSFSVF